MLFHDPGHIGGDIVDEQLSRPSSCRSQPVHGPPADRQGGGSRQRHANGVLAEYLEGLVEQTLAGNSRRAQAELGQCLIDERPTGAAEQRAVEIEDGGGTAHGDDSSRHRAAGALTRRRGRRGGTPTPSQDSTGSNGGSTDSCGLYEIHSAESSSISQQHESDTWYRFQ